VRYVLSALILTLVTLAGPACGEDPCPPFRKAVCSQCGEKSAACQELRLSLQRAVDENRDLDALCEKGHDRFKDLEGDRCRTTP